MRKLIELLIAFGITLLWATPLAFIAGMFAKINLDAPDYVITWLSIGIGSLGFLLTKKLLE